MNQIKRKNYLGPFLVLFILITTVLTVLNISLTYYETEKFSQNDLQKNLEYELKTKSKDFQNLVNNKINILNSIENSNSFKQYLNNPNTDMYINDLLKSIITSNENIMQIRFIDMNGLEQIRFDRENKNILKIENLQDKSDRYYFTEAIKKDINKVYISNLDLNVERGTIQKPINPTIRVAKSVYDENLNVKGIFIINLFMKKHLDNIVYSNLFNVYIHDDKNNIIYSNDTSKTNFEKYLNETNKKEFLDKTIGKKQLLDSLNEQIYISITPKKSKGLEEYLLTIIFEIIIFTLPLSVLLAYLLSRIPKKLFDKLEEEHEVILYQSKQNAISEMIVMIAHQWRQPLTVISLLAQEIMFAHKFDMIDKKTSAKLGEQLLGKIDSLSLSIDEFREFFKNDENKKNVDLLKCVQDLKKIMNSNLLENGIQFNITTLNNTNHEEPFKTDTYKSKFNQIIVNLVSNSTQAIDLNSVSGEDKFINIELQRNTNSVKISIEDSGKGIESKHLPKIFDPYFSTDEKVLQGKGLGLYFVKSLVETHFNGTINAQNTENGAKFIVVIPV